MIRLVQRKLILPRGDTGSFTIPVLPNFNIGDIAVFAIFNPLNKTIIFKKQVEIINQEITVQLSHNQTVNLPAGKYLWDIKAYLNPVYADGELVNGDQIDSYYAGYKLPECQIRETSDNYLLADNAPTSTLSSAQLDIISVTLAQIRDAVQQTQENVSHYPIIINEEWYTWNSNTNQYIGTGVRVPARISDLIDDSGHYIKPTSGIPANDLAEGVIPDISIKTDKVSNAIAGNFASLDSQGNLIDSGHKHSDYLTQHQDISGKQDTLIFDDIPTTNSNNPVKSSGIKSAIDAVVGSIPNVTGKADKVSNATSGNFATLDANGNLTDSGSKASDFLTQHQTIPVTDVQINGVSIVSSGIADVPVASSNDFGAVKTNTSYGTGVTASGMLYLYKALESNIKAGTTEYRPIVPYNQHQAAFYGLAKAAGDTTQASSSNATGTYTETAQSKIHEMLDAPVMVSGTDPVIIGKAGIRYICGECNTLTLTPPASGIVDVVFTSGITPTVLSVPNTVKWPGWFDSTSLDASTTYKLNIMDGVYGAVMAWT